MHGVSDERQCGNVVSVVVVVVVRGVDEAVVVATWKAASTNTASTVPCRVVCITMPGESC